MSPSELARALAARRQRITATCEVCGAGFETWKRKTQQARTCSNRCRQQLHRDKKRAVTDPENEHGATIGTRSTP